MYQGSLQEVYKFVKEIIQENGNPIKIVSKLGKDDYTTIRLTDSGYEIYNHERNEVTGEVTENDIAEYITGFVATISTILIIRRNENIDSRYASIVITVKDPESSDEKNYRIDLLLLAPNYEKVMILLVKPKDEEEENEE